MSALIVTGNNSGLSYLVTEDAEDVVKLLESAQDNLIDIVRFTSGDVKNCPIFIHRDAVVAVHAVDPYRLVAIKEDELVEN